MIDRTKTGKSKSRKEINKNTPADRQAQIHRYNIITATALFIISLTIISHYKLSFLYFWDEFYYIKTIISHDTYTYVFPRVMYFEFYALIWKIAGNFNVDPFTFHNTIRTINIIFASATIPVYYLFITELTKKRIFAIGSSLLLLSTPYFIRYSGTILQEVMMLFFIMLSFYLFTSGIKNNKANRLYLAAISFGIACSVREQAIAFIIFFIVLALTEPESRLISKRTYLLASAIFIAAILVPIISIYPPESCFNRLIYYISLNRAFGVMNNMTAESMSEHIYTSINLLSISSGSIIFILCFLGIILMFDKAKTKELAYILTLLAPTIILVFFGGHTSRHYLCTLIGLTLSAMYMIKMISSSISSKSGSMRKNTILIAIVLLIFAYNINSTNNLITNENKEITHHRTYWEQISTEFSNDTVFMVGLNTAITEHFTTQAHSNNIILRINAPGNSGLLEPKSNHELEQTIEKYLSENRTIIVDTDNSGRMPPLDIQLIKNKYSPQTRDALLIIQNS